MTPQPSGAPPARNAPCPCGSGRKYKHCCLGRAEVKARVDSSAEGLLQEARTHLEAGRPRRARDACRSVLERWPRNSIALFYLGQAVARLGNRVEGIRLHREAIAVDGGRAPYHLSLADLLQQETRFDEALAAAERAAALDPRDVSAHTLAAICHDRMNRPEDGIAAARRGLDVAPGDANAAIVLAQLEARAGHLDLAQGRLEAVLRGPGPLSAFLHARALHELGVVLDQRGAWDEAFDAMTRSGAEQARSEAARRVDPELESRRIRAYRTALPPDLLARHASERYDEPHGAPGFLVGFPRSGTTMTEQVLAAHPDIVSSDEIPLLNGVIDEMARLVGEGPSIPAMLARLDRAGIESLRAWYWQAAESVMGMPLAERVFVDKNPLNLIHVVLVNVIFPDARVIVALRDPRDVCLSCFFQDFALNAGMINFLSLERTARLYAEVMDLWLYLREFLTVPFVEVRYEDTVTDLEGQSRRILELLGLPWDDSLLCFHEKARSRQISTPSYAAVAQPVYTKSVGRWRNYARHFEPVASDLHRYVQAFGYEENGT